MIFHQKNYEDIKRYYNNTIIKLPELSGDRLWQIVHITPAEVKLIDVDGMEIYMDLEHEYQVEYPLPGRAVYQMSGGSAGILYRKPARQYFRGLSKENTALGRYTSSGDIVGASWGIHTLQEFVDKPCYQDVNTIDFNNDFNESWALNKHMVLCRQGPVIVQTKRIALVYTEDKTVIVIHELFKPEIKAAFPGWEIK